DRRRLTAAVARPPRDRLAQRLEAGVGAERVVGMGEVGQRRLLCSRLREVPAHTQLDAEKPFPYRPATQQTRAGSTGGTLLGGGGPLSRLSAAHEILCEGSARCHAAAS